MTKIFLVYYNQLPPAIDDLPKEDKRITVTKEGVRPYKDSGTIFPRVCIRIQSVSSSEDKDRELKVSNLLQYLKTGRQIIDFSKQG